jgi:hypothetical protein
MDRRADLLAAAILVAIGLAALWPFIWISFPWHVWTQQFLHEMQGGTLFPRWLSGMNGGLGSPVFFFYGPVSFWLTSFAGFAGAHDPLIAIEIVTAATLAGSGLAAYAWLRSLVPATAATLGAALYAVLPYHLTLDLWTRAAFGEFNAFAWTPLVFLGIEWIRARRPAGFALLALAYALLVMTHIVTAMLVTCLAGIYILLRATTLRSILFTGCAMALGAAISAAYLATALGLTQHTVYQTHSVAMMWFLPATMDGHPRVRMMQMLTVLVVMEFVLALAMLTRALLDRSAPQRRLTLIWAALAAVTLLCTTRPFEPLWNHLPILSNAQFPFRILAFTDLGIATTAALTLQPLLARARRPGRLAGPLLAVIALFGVLQVLLPLKIGAFERSLSAWVNEFPVQGDYRLFRPLASGERLPMDTDATKAPAVPLLSIIQGTATATLVEGRSRHYAVAIDAAGPAVLRLGQLHFAGWRATMDGTPLPLHPSDAMGLVEIELPPGRYTVLIDLARTPVEQAGIGVSAAALLLWAVLLARLVLRRQPTRIPSTAS